MLEGDISTYSIDHTARLKGKHLIAQLREAIEEIDCSQRADHQIAKVLGAMTSYLEWISTQI